MLTNLIKTNLANLILSFDWHQSHEWEISPISSHKCSPISSHYCSSISSEKKSHRSHQKKSLINLIRKKGLTNLIGALGSMAATSRSENQAVAQLWFHVVDVWIYLRFGSTFGFKGSSLGLLRQNISFFFTISRLSTKGAILPGVFDVTQESPITSMTERLGMRTRASLA